MKHFDSQQPLVPVLPVARELISKTKWIASKGAVQIDTQTAKGEGADKPSSESARSHSNRRWRKSALGEDMPPSSLILTAEPESVLPDAGNLSDGDRVSSPPKSRSRMFNILHRKTSSRSRTHNTVSSEGSSDVRDSLLCCSNGLIFATVCLISSSFRHHHCSLIPR